MKVALVVNPFAGGKKAKVSFPDVVQNLKARGINLDVFVSQFSSHIYEIGKNLDVSAYDAILPMGGDGTNFHLINGLLSSMGQTIPPIGVLPAGSGNSFARDLGIHTIDQGIESIVRNNPCQVDVCSFTQSEKRTYFINLMGFGFVTDVAKTAESFKRTGAFSYVIGVVRQTIDLDFHLLSLEVDGKTFTGKNCFVEFCNSRYTGGNMLMAPDAKIDDGFMDIIIASPMSKKRLISALPRIFDGSHVLMPEITCIKAKKAIVSTQPQKALLPDGEIFGSTPTIVEIHPKMLRFFR